MDDGQACRFVLTDVNQKEVEHEYGYDTFEPNIDLELRGKRIFKQYDLDGVGVVIMHFREDALRTTLRMMEETGHSVEGDYVYPLHGSPCRFVLHREELEADVTLEVGWDYGPLKKQSAKVGRIAVRDWVESIYDISTHLSALFRGLNPRTYRYLRGQESQIARLGDWLTWQRLGIAHGCTVLNVGFGRATELLALASVVGRDGAVYGVELGGSLVKRALEEVREHQNMRVLAGNAYHVPLPDKAVDVVIFKGVLHEVRDVFKALGEASRVCRDGGTVIIVDFERFSENWLRASNRKWLARHPWKLLSGSPDKHAGFSRDKLTEHAARSGLSIRSYMENFASGHFSGHEVRMFLLKTEKNQKPPQLK